LYEVKLDVFEGPLDLLLHLIQKAQIDIYDIPISDITDQYLVYLGAMHEMDLEVASAFVTLAATLLSIKVRMLLPRKRLPGAQDDPDEDPRAGLVQALVEYSTFKKASEALGSSQQRMALLYTRPPEPVADRWVDSGPIKATLWDLIGAMRHVLERLQPPPPLEIRIEPFSLKTAFLRVLRAVRRNPGQRATLFSIFEGLRARTEAIMVFIATLELGKQGRIRLVQHAPYADITLIFQGKTRP
jgi:segregation and condensation protein A